MGFLEDLKDRIIGNETIFISMKTNELKQILRKLISEEVKKEVQAQLPKLLFEMIGKQPTAVKTNSNPSSPVISESRGKPIVKSAPQPIVEKPLKKYAKDPLLNQILNETTPGLPQSPYGTSVLAALDDDFDKLGISDEFAGELREVLNENTTQPSQPTSPESTGTDLNKLFNKPFKQILERSKQKSGGGMSSVGAVSMQNW
jgi:hypothetical protein